MRIISKVKDFYDIGMSMGVDQSVVYVRETKIIEPENQYKYWRGTLNEAIIGFCGKVYPCIYTLDWKTINNVFYNSEDLEKYLRANPSKYDYELRRGNWNLYKSHFEYYNKPETSKYYEKTFLDHNVPIFVIEGRTRLTLNPILRPYQFYKVLDPYNAYQELTMYVGGVLLGPTKPIPVPDDVTLAECKGFDKWSFRKEGKSK